MNKKVLIRSGVYETNSSSTHCITLQEDINKDTSLLPDKEGFIYLTTGEFEWEWESYGDSYNKASYLLTDCKSLIENNNEKNILLLEKYINNLKEVIKKNTYCKDVLYKGVDNIVFPLLKGLREEEEDGRYSDSFSVVDHQSSGISYEILNNKEYLYNFIFNKNSYLFTGNDNEQRPDTFYKNYDPNKTIKAFGFNPYRRFKLL